MVTGDGMAVSKWEEKRRGGKDDIFCIIRKVSVLSKTCECK